MNYSDDLDKVINNAMSDLIHDYSEGAIVFDEKKNNEYLEEYLKLKTKYNEWCYIISDIKADDIDWYIENLNKKSEKAYQEYVLRGYK